MQPLNPRKIGKIIIIAVMAIVVIFIIVMLILKVMVKPAPLNSNSLGALINAPAKN